MEDITESFARRVAIMREGPILYRGDPDIPALISAELSDLIGEGVPEAALRATVETFEAVRRDTEGPVADEYRRAYAKLVVDIQNDDLWKAYQQGPSVVRLNRLLDKYLDVAPRTTILRAANLRSYHNAFLNAHLAPLDAEEHAHLVEARRTLDAIMVDSLSLEEAVKQVQVLLLAQGSLVSQWILVLGYTPEGFYFTIPDQPRYEWDRTLTSFIFTGLRNHLESDRSSVDYAVWWSQVTTYAGAKCPQYLGLINAAFPAPSLESLGSIVPPELLDVVELAGEAYAFLCTVYETEAVQQMILPRLAHMYLQGLAPEMQPLDLPFRNWAWSMLPALSETAQGTMEAIARWIVTARKLATAWAAPATILSPFFGVGYTTGVALYEFIDKCVEVLVYGLDKIGRPFARWLKEYLYLGRAWSNVVLPGARRRPKSVWALLFVNDFTRLDPGTRFALSCNVMTETPPPSYEEWESRFQKDINATGLADFKLYSHPPLRPLRLPRDPITVDEEILALAPLFPGQARETDIMDEKMEKWVQYNVPQGIDGQWFATPERVAASIRRYQTQRIEPDDNAINIAREAAHALADQYPEMYKAHRYFTLEHAMRRLKWDTNMSPGLGFIGNVRTRKQLRKHGFLDAITKVARDRLQRGIHPGSVAHAFVKEQVVSLDKLLKGKNIRTVTAQALIANTMALPFSIELSRAPPPEAYVLNALPRSEGGYRPLLEDLRKHALILQADATEFDSKLGPVITVEGLAELRSIGFESNPAFPQIASQIRQHYYHMRYAKIVDLTTGIVFDKDGGLLTGQVNTSYDNRDAFRLMMIMGYIAITGRPGHTFFDTTTLGNAGDDDLFGTDLPKETWLEIFAWLKDRCGVTMNIEAEGWDQISITALQPIAETAQGAYYRCLLGMPTADFGIRTEPAKLLLSKTEFRARTARLRDIPFRQAHIDTMVGTAYLSAYNPEIYQDLADLYLADMRYVLLRFYQNVDVTEHRDKFGNLTDLHVTGSQLRARYRRVGDRIDSMIRSWQKKVKWPSYQRVFSIWVRPYSPERSSIAKHYRTLIAGGPALPVTYKLLYGLVGFREALYKIPNHLVRALPEFPGADVSVTLRTPEFIVERFVWLSLFHKRKSVPTKQGFMQALREGPYAAAASPIDFLEHLELEGAMQELIATDLEMLRGQAVLVTLIYTALEKILNMAAQIPLLGLPLTLYALSTRDVNRLYATANHVYWLAEGRSSAVISNLMPADPYAWMKQLAVILVSGVPARWVAIPGLRHLLTWAPTLVEAWVMASSTVSPNVGRVVFKELPTHTPWGAVVDNLLAANASGDVFSATIVAPTGSGKSTLFVALLRVIYPHRKIWLLHPTIAARDEYANDFLHVGDVQTLVRGTDISFDASVYSLTYGYFTQIWQNVLPTDLILFDEAHLSATEMWVAWFLSSANIRIALTATPKWSLQPKTPHVWHYPGSRRFRMQMTYVNQTFEELWTTLANGQRHILHRALIICATLTEVNYVRNTLARLSFASSELSRDQPQPAKQGIIVATSIADQALTIDPPPSVVIDLGTMLRVTQRSELGHLFPVTDHPVIPVSQEVADQRAGRGGRSSDGVGYGLINAPRSEHVAPARHAAAVFLVEDVVDQVLAVFKLRNGLTTVVQMPGLLQFVDVSRDIYALDAPHNIAGCAVALLYLSAGADFDVFTNDLLNAKYVNLVSDALRVSMGQVKIRFPDLDPLQAEPLTTRELLETGVFQCTIGQTKLPVAAFMFVSGWLMPCGHDPSAHFPLDAPVAFPNTTTPIFMRGIRAATWPIVLEGFTAEGIVSGLPSMTAMPLRFWETDSREVVSPLRYDAWVNALLSRVRRSGVGAARAPNHIIMTVDLLGYVDGRYTLNVATIAPVDPLRNVRTVPLTELGVTIHSLFALMLVVACEFADDQSLGAGVCAASYIRQDILRTDRVCVTGPVHDPSWIRVSPLVARRVFIQAARAITTGNIFPVKQSLPIVVLDSPDHLGTWLDAGWHAQLGTVVNDRLNIL